ncbi:DUF2750 domain-containing protein [Marinomonas posidonica]|uniref:DUF2750 domain-containing protein n=1 Tax=Marinomonas posidonica TaxID=936476 RepID=UPI00373536D8
MSDTQFDDAFFRLTSNDRYSKMVQRVRQGHSIWTLADEQGCLVITLNTDQVLPVWPNEAMASHWGEKDYPDFKGLEISAIDWLEKWLPGMTADKYSVGAAPNMAGECIVSSAEEHSHDIKPA